MFEAKTSTPTHHNRRGPINCSSSAESIPPKNRAVMCAAALLLWLLIVIVTSAKHELWRDEVRALSIAMEPNWFWELPTAVKNEGHPILWYVILRVGFSVFHTPVILKVISICIACGAVVVFFRYAPFPVWQKTLFLWGVFPLYYYSVMARSYGLSMFLFFLFCSFYNRRKQFPFLLACVLFALANTNMHSCILVGVLSVFWFWDELVMTRGFLNANRVITLSSAFALAVIGMFGAIITSLASHTTVWTEASALNTSEVLQALWMNMKHLGTHFGNVLPGLTVLQRDVLIWLLIAGLLSQPMAALSLFVGTVLLGSFFTIGYPGRVYHQGIFIIYCISLYWIVYQKQKTTNPKSNLIRHLHSVHNVSCLVVVSVILSLHVILSIDQIRVDILHDMSSSRAFGEFLKTHPEYRKAIIMGEPDYLLESLPYYTPNRIYIPREERFGNRVMFTRVNRERLSLSELLGTAREITNREGKPVLIALGLFDLSKYAGCELRYPPNKVFTVSSEGLTRFRAETDKIAEFKSAVLDENYEIYLFH
jgi:hypothetical protein